MSIIHYSTLYKRSVSGKVSTWQVTVDGNTFYTISGYKDGKKITSEPTICTAKNIGKSNEESVRAVLKNLHIPIIAAKTGGEKGYQIDYDLEDGSVLCRVFGQETQEF